MLGFLKNAENAHSKIDSLMKGDPMKDYLKNMTGLKDMYKFGAKDSLMFRNNLINSLVSSTMNKDLNFEDLFGLSLGGDFGKKDKFNWMLSGGKDKANLNVGMNLDILKGLFK
tara:strand:+ start:185 stop:523 length:339 start_codon:yes stop_codon:yes gene_type:complete